MARKISNETTEAQPGSTLIIPLDWILVVEADNQRRYTPKADEIKDLAESIKRQNGLINPLTVRELTAEEQAACNGGGEKYKLVAGYQRVRALAWLNEQGEDFSSVEVKVQAAGAGVGDEAPVSEHVRNIITNLDENMRRKDLGVIDKAVAAKTLTTPVEENGAGMTQGQAARQMKMKQGTVSQLLALLTLRPEVQRKINEGLIQFSAAREFPNLPEDEQDKLIAEAESSGKTVTGAVATSTRKKKGKAKSTRGRKGKEEEGDGGKGISAKQARAMMGDLATEIEAEEGRKTKAQTAAVALAGLFGDLLGGKFGLKAFKKRLMAELE